MRPARATPVGGSAPANGSSAPSSGGIAPPSGIPASVGRRLIRPPGSKVLLGSGPGLPLVDGRDFRPWSPRCAVTTLATSPRRRKMLPDVREEQPSPVLIEAAAL